MISAAVSLLLKRSFTKAIINERILKAVRLPQVLYIDQDGCNRGAQDIHELLGNPSIDRNQYDLLLVSTQEDVASNGLSVVRLVDRSQRLQKEDVIGQLALRDRRRRKEKEIIIGTSADAHDVETKKCKIKQLLEREHRVKIAITGRGVNRGDPFAREQLMQTVLMQLQEEYGSRLKTIVPPESFNNVYFTVVHLAGCAI